jgi:hypothetical protein
MENRWFKNAVIYCVDIDRFATEMAMASEILLGCDRH